jgi:hypothetical protein
MRIMLTYLMTFTFFVLFGQKTSVSLDPKKIKVGESVRLVYTISLPSDAAYKYTPFGTTLPSRKQSENATLVNEVSSDIEQTKPFRDTIFKKDGQKIWVGTYEITGWSDGKFVISGSKIIVNDSTVQFPDAALTIGLVNAKKGADIYDIEESFAELPPKPNKIIEFVKSYYWLIILLVMIGAMALFIYIRNKRISSLVPVDEMSLKERSLLAIDLLEKERLWEKGKLKEHYIELSFILRSYLSARYDLNLLENTTKQTQLLLGHKSLHAETIKVIGTVLNQSDMVKFARSAPDEMEVLKISQLVRQVIAETSPIEFDHAE